MGRAASREKIPLLDGIAPCRRKMPPKRRGKEVIMAEELAKTYDPKGIEDRLYEKWMEKKYFHAEVDRSRKPFTIVIPPPNITGQLHMGHALDNTMQDILIRLGMEERIRRKDHRPAEEAWLIL